MREADFCFKNSLTLKLRVADCSFNSPSNSSPLEELFDGRSLVERGRRLITTGRRGKRGLEGAEWGIGDQNSSYRYQRSDYELLRSNIRLQITEIKDQTANYRDQRSDYRQEISNIRIQSIKIKANPNITIIRKIRNT